MRGLLRECLGLLAVALAAAALLSWRLAREQTMVGTFDVEQIFWQGLNLLRVLATGDPLLRTSFLGVATPFTYTPAMHLYALPLLALSRLTNPWFAASFMALSVLALNAVSMYALLRVAGLQRGPSALGALVWFSTPSLLRRAFVHPYLAEAFYLPVVFLVAWRDRREGYRAWHWAALGAVVALMLGAHEYHGIGGAAVVAVVMACAAPRLGLRRTLAAATWCGGAFVFLSAPVLWMYFAQRAFDRAHGVLFERPLGESVILSAAPDDFIRPSLENPLYGQVPGLGVVITESFNYLGLVNLAALALVVYWALLRRDRLRAFLEASPFVDAMRAELSLTGLGAFTVSLGPRLKGLPTVWMPVGLLLALHVPPFAMMRGWARFGWMVSFVLTVLLAHLASFLGWRTRWLVAIALVALVDQWSLAALPTFRVAVPSAVDTIRAEPGDPFVLHLPFGSKSGALHNGVGQFLQGVHGKRLAGGYGALDNPLFLDLVASSPLAGIDCDHFEGHPPPVPDELYAFLVAHDVRFIVYEKKTQFHPHWLPPERDAALRRVTLDTLHRLPLQVLEDDDDYTVYRVGRPATGGS